LKTLPVVCASAVVFLLLLFASHEQRWPNSFTANLFSDATSSAASRVYNASMIFQEGKLVSGSQQYESWSGTTHLICRARFDANSSSWTKSAEYSTREFASEEFEWRAAEVPSEACDSVYVLATNKNELQKILSTELFQRMPVADCLHGEACYEIIK